MNDEQIAKSLLDMKRLVMQPGDALVLKADTPLTLQQTECIYAVVKARLGKDAKVLIIGSDIQCSVVAGV